MKEKTREGPLELAVYGKGGIGKSTVSANLSAALAMAGKKVLQIGCDPKHDSTRLLTHGELIPTVLDYLRTVPAAEAEVGAVLRSGICGIGCIEAGGPQPGVGCAGRGIITAFEFLEKHRRLFYATSRMHCALLEREPPPAVRGVPYEPEEPSRKQRDI